MKNSQEIAKLLYGFANDKTLNKWDRIKKIENELSWHINDVLKLIKNINETSVNEQDRVERLIHAEHTYGIPKTHLL
jgi:hypothetical protein